MTYMKFCEGVIRYVLERQFLPGDAGQFIKAWIYPRYDMALTSLGAVVEIGLLSVGVHKTLWGGYVLERQSNLPGDAGQFISLDISSL